MKQNREQELMTRLSIVQKLSLGEAMELLNISESTARRMFAKLEQDGFAIRTHGGVQCVNHAMTLYSFEYGARTNIRKKTAIAREACTYLEDGDVLFDDNYFDLNAGEKRVRILRGEGTKFRARSVYDIR